MVAGLIPEFPKLGDLFPLSPVVGTPMYVCFSHAYKNRIADTLWRLQFYF